MRKISSTKRAKALLFSLLITATITGASFFSLTSQGIPIKMEAEPRAPISGTGCSGGDCNPLHSAFMVAGDVVQGSGRKQPVANVPERSPLAIPRPGEIWREPVTGMELVWVLGGCFEMGSPSVEVGRDPDEGPVHEVCVDGFWMGKSEVTNAQYRRFKADYDSGYYRGHSLNGDDQPVVFINWYEAKAFAKWLTELSGGRYDFRLPTEAEWEYSCRAGTNNTRFWGDAPEEACGYANVADLTAGREWSYWVVNECEDGYAVTAPVGSFKPNAFGLYDMLGNVFEWCEDAYDKDAYRHHRRNNPIHTGSGSHRVIRGGCWYSWPAGVRCAGRSDHPPEGQEKNRYGDYFLGFRLVRTP